jgi:hypothetical protein
MAFLCSDLVIFLLLQLIHTMQLDYFCAHYDCAGLVWLRPRVPRVRMRSLFGNRARRFVSIEKRLKIVNRSDRARNPDCIIQLVVPLHPY